MLKRFQMEDCNPTNTLMVTGCTLSKKDESPLVDQTRYRSVIGSIYNMQNTTPKETHVKEITRIFKYLQHKKDYGLW